MHIMWLKYLFMDVYFCTFHYSTVQFTVTL